MRRCRWFGHAWRTVRRWQPLDQGPWFQDERCRRCYTFRFFTRWDPTRLPRIKP